MLDELLCVDSLKGSDQVCCGCKRMVNLLRVYMYLYTDMFKVVSFHFVPCYLEGNYSVVRFECTNLSEVLFF